MFFTSRRVQLKFLIVGAAWTAKSLGNYLPFQGNSFNGLDQRSYEPVDSVADLVARLSPGAKVSVPGEESFNNSTGRWSTYKSPDFVINVEVAVEKDVVETIKFANERNKPYLAVNGGHGATQTVGKVKNGIQISMRRLNSINVANDGKTVTFGGGTISVDITAKLWEAGKQTGEKPTSMSFLSLALAYINSHWYMRMRQLYWASTWRRPRLPTRTIWSSCRPIRIPESCDCRRKAQKNR